MLARIFEEVRSRTDVAVAPYLAELEFYLARIEELVRRRQPEAFASVRYFVRLATARASILQSWIPRELQRRFESEVHARLDAALRAVGQHRDAVPAQAVVRIGDAEVHLLCAVCGVVAKRVRGNVDDALRGDLVAVQKRYASSVSEPKICPDCNKAYCKRHFPFVRVSASVPDVVGESTCPKGHKVRKVLSLPVT